MAAVTYSNNDLNRFWLQILGDNALMVFNAISPQEAEDAPKAKALAEKFDALALRANNKPTPEQTAQINKEAREAAQDFSKFLLQILTTLLTKRYHIDLKPTLLNDFLLESNRYIDLLDMFIQNKKPVYNPLLEEIFWLPRFSVQNKYIDDNLGYYQVQTRRTAGNLANYLINYSAYSVDLKGLSRIGTEDFPLTKSHHVAVFELLNTYYKFLSNLISLQRNKMLPGSVSLLYLDRSRRILCHFLLQLAQFLDTKAPDCDPYSKRISNN